MRPEQFGTLQLVETFRREKVLTVPSIQRLLQSPSQRTVARKLAALGAKASYSHAGKYYTLDECADYDGNGLWSFHKIYFSKYGTLMNTIVHLVHAWPQGYFASELQSLLQVRVHNTLTALYSRERLLREQIGHQYLYLSTVLAEQQLQNRYGRIQRRYGRGQPTFGGEDWPEGIQESLRFLMAQLNEQQRRLYLGMESMKLGHGGDARIAQMSGVNVKTIARGRRELEAKQVSGERVRGAGGGRKPLKKNRSDPAFE